MHLVSLAKRIFPVGLTTVDHEQNGVVEARKGEVIEQIAQHASGWKRDVEAPQRPRRRGPLQRRVEMNGDGDLYQLKILSRSASDAS